MKKLTASLFLRKDGVVTALNLEKLFSNILKKIGESEKSKEAIKKSIRQAKRYEPKDVAELTKDLGEVEEYLTKANKVFRRVIRNMNRKHEAKK